MADPRSYEQRKLDTLAKLTQPAVDVWVATAGVQAHLIPLSLAWIDERAVIALDGQSITARNISQSGQARLGLGPTRDVVLIDATLDARHAITAAPANIADAYAAQADWDPRTAGECYIYLVLKPMRIQAWREANEIAGRTLMRDGSWL